MLVYRPNKMVSPIQREQHQGTSTVPAAAQLSPQSTHSDDWALCRFALRPCAPWQYTRSVPSLPSGAARIPHYDTPALLRGALALDVLNCRVQF